VTTFDKNTDFAKLIPELKDWNNGNGIGIDGWTSCEGDHKHLIGYARILWPDFIEHDGCIFLGNSVDEDNYQAFLRRNNGDKTAVEAVMNHQHIVDLFSRSRHERPTREVILYIGRLMKEMWQTKLDSVFSGRRIRVNFPEDYLDDLLEYQITFFQER